jgi:hypothetical protein
MSNLDIIDSLYEHQDIVDWINHTLDQNSSNRPLGLNDLEQRVTQLVPALEVACEDTSSRLERVIDDRYIPRDPYDLNFMKDGALSLQTRSMLFLQKQSRLSVVYKLSAP